MQARGAPCRPAPGPHIASMVVGMVTGMTASITGRDGRRRWRRLSPVRHALFTLGCLLILITPVLGVLPGPGGVFVFAAGAALVLETSPRARRGYVRLKRRWPRLGDWIDWGLRRPSRKRRRERRAAPGG